MSLGGSSVRRVSSPREPARGDESATQAPAGHRRRAALFWIHHIDWPAVILVLLALVYGLWRLDTAPALFWDEGWALEVARNWVEQGHYGHLLAGQPTAVAFGAAPHVIASVALSFRLFGVGVWQGRLPIVLYAVAAVVVLYDLARRLYNRRIATGTLTVALLMSPLFDIHPLCIGRVVLAETPMLFFLLAGYLCFLLTLQKSVWFMPLAVLCWGIGVATKTQPLPFWAMSLVVPLLVMLLRRRWKEAVLLTVGLLGSLGVLESVKWLWRFVPGHGMSAVSLSGGIQAHALVLVPQVRFAAFAAALIAGFPTVFGLCNETLQRITKRGAGDLDPKVSLVRSAVLLFVGSWFAWYVLLSVGWHRYLFPAMLPGSMFAAALLYDLSGGFHWLSALRRAVHAVTHMHFDRQGAGALLAIVMVAIMLPNTLYMLGSFCIAGADTSAQRVASYLNTHTASDTLVEAYSPEVFFLLDRDYHYPPFQTNIDIIRGQYWGQDVPADYDPLSADPDYLVVCRRYGAWTVYSETLASGAFRLLRTEGPYEVYERVR